VRIKDIEVQIRFRQPEGKRGVLVQVRFGRLEYARQLTPKPPSVGRYERDTLVCSLRFNGGGSIVSARAGPESCHGRG